MALYSYKDYKLWMRIFDKRIITEDGVYAEDSVPTEYAGSELELEFNQVIIMGDGAGSFMAFRVEDTEDLMDEEDKTGIGYTYDLYGHTVSVPASGDSALVVEWYVKTYPDNFPNTSDEKMQAMHQKSMVQEGIVAEDFEFQELVTV